MKKIILAMNGLLLSAIISSFMGCLSDAEWENISRSLGQWDDFRMPPHPKQRLTLSIDSAQQKNDSSLTLWMHATYDSVIILCRYGVNYWESSDSQMFQEIFDVKPDTIDFRKLKNFNYLYTLQMDTLKSNTYYSICTFLDHLYKGDTVRIHGSIYQSGCLALRTK